MEIITLHEREQAAELSKPLWVPHNTCNNNCRQGRACDCTAAIDDDEPPPRPPMTATDALVSLGLCAACWGVVAAGYLILWGPI